MLFFDTTNVQILYNLRIPQTAVENQRQNFEYMPLEYAFDLVVMIIAYFQGVLD